MILLSSGPLIMTQMLLKGDKNSRQLQWKQSVIGTRSGGIQADKVKAIACMSDAEWCDHLLIPVEILSPSTGRSEVRVAFTAASSELEGDRNLLKDASRSIAMFKYTLNTRMEWTACALNWVFGCMLRQAHPLQCNLTQWQSFCAPF